ncbi:Pectinesterase inhibitor domain [Macleaya cordata]|uniref:Pectinesterase inhibitor domain n=1 Tax=Macleaya cordata TaxID=56857 RepID=A0A200QAT1_MACCD|nr:Pectinesterase inhibitor domain [Macleaya cordata]
MKFPASIDTHNDTGHPLKWVSIPPNMDSSVDIINETCRKAANSNPSLIYNFCLTSLRSNPKSQTADLRELGVISMELCLKNATYIKSHIGKLLLLDDGLDPRSAKHEFLRDCFELYKDAIIDLNDAIKAFEAKDYVSTYLKMKAAMDASMNCEDRFQMDGLVFPLAKEDSDDFFKLTANAIDITYLSRSLFDYSLSVSDDDLEFIAIFVVQYLTIFVLFIFFLKVVWLSRKN